MTILLHNIGEKINSNYDTYEEILDVKETISFDGVYKNVFENRSVLKDKEVYLFIIGDYIGEDNSFDMGQKLEKFCNWQEIETLTNKYKCKLGWHTWTHRDLTKLSDEEVRKELITPFPMKYFAYPYGHFNNRIIELVKEAGFKDAWSVGKGNDERYQRLRKHL